MLTLHVITASTREARKGRGVAEWFLAQARGHDRFAIEDVDLAKVNLPMFDEPRHPRLGQYEHEHTRRWSAIVDRADAFVFVTPEYNYSAPASLTNAIDFLYREWLYKPVGFVSYGGVAAGTRSVQIMKLTVTALKMMPMFEAVTIPFFAQHFKADTGAFDPGDVQAKAAVAMLDELLKWANALKPLRGT